MTSGSSMLAITVSRPPIAEERLALTSSGQVRYQLKTRYRDGTTHIVLEPLDFIARLAALVPPQRMHLTRFHGVFAPHSKLRAAVTPAHRGMGAAQYAAADPASPPTLRHVAMSWARRLKRVFGIEIEGCARCGGKLAILASIEEPEVIAKILSHLERSARGRRRSRGRCFRRRRVSASRLRGDLAPPSRSRGGPGCVRCGPGPIEVSCRADQGVPQAVPDRSGLGTRPLRGAVRHREPR